MTSTSVRRSGRTGTAFEDRRRCPDPDNDKTVSADGIRQMPHRSRGQGRVEDRDGCPDPDNDKTGWRRRRQVPERSEDKDGFEDADGCPDPDMTRMASPTGDKCP